MTGVGGGQWTIAGGGKSLHVGLPLNGSAVIYLSAQTLSSLLRGQLDAASARSSGQLALEGGSSADRESAIEMLSRVLQTA